MTKPAAACVVTTALLFLLPLGAFGQVNFDIRLTGGMTPNEGRVEVYYSSQWRTICHDAWDIYDAHVVCRQLGYRGAIRHHTSSYFRGVSSNIFTSHVYCTGTESYIYECSRGYGVTSFPYYCSSNTNAGVTCSPERITDDGAVRLASGTTANQGRIEILLQGQWTTICQHGTTETTAQTVCKQLGYSDYDGYQTGAHHGQGRGLISMRNVNCGGYEPDVVSCRRSYYGLFADHGCQHNHDIGASCANNGDVRLSDGSSSSGRVEVFTRGQWQAVSTNSWDIFDAHVVCRQLGFRGARRTYHISNMLLDGSGSGTVMRVLNNLDCSGTESSLLNCTHNRLRAPDFTRARDAAAQCYYQESNGAVRLVDGPTANEGRVEVFFGRRWHTVCDSNWDLNDAHSVCRYMGYSGASAARGQAYYGEGTGEIILEDVGCTGSSESPVSCRHNGLFVTSCTHKQDAGVECHHNGDIRLVPTTNDSAVHSGSIEVFYITQWYPVSGQGWNLLAAQVVCRQLGYSGAKSAGNGRVWYGRAWSFSRCRGLESNLFSCRRRSSVSTRHQLAECTCTKEQYISAGALRLVNGHTFSKGQVEVWLNGQWNFICDDYWGRKEAAVVCKEIGYTAGALSAHKGAKFGHGRGTLLLDDVECGRHDSSLLSCSHVGLYPRSCNKYKAAGVTCSDDRNGDVRLAGGRGPHIGRVEVYSEGEWYTICDNLWDIADAHVVCTQLGYKGAVAAHKGAHFGQGSGSILKDHVDCSGQESSLLECPSRAGSLCTGCTHANDAGVTCAEGNNNFGFRVRLVDGSTANQGRVELWMGGRWHSVCDDLWDLNDGSVVCRSLGYSGASAVSDNANYGEGKGDIILDNVNCTGNETHIAHCEHNGLLQEDCGHSEDAGVVCQQEGDVRLADGLTRREGRVEIYLKGQWTSVCGATWDARDASIVCRQLGYRGYASISRRSQFGQGTSILHDTVNCEGEERGLVECLQEAEATKDCNNRREAGVVCHTSKYTTGDLRLVNGSNSKQGLVEMFFKGHWSGLCGTTWNSVIAHVICKDLGYSSAKSYRTESTRAYTPANKIKINQLSCSSDHNMLSSCSHSGLIPRGCSGHNFVYIVCA